MDTVRYAPGPQQRIDGRLTAFFSALALLVFLGLAAGLVSAFLFVVALEFLAAVFLAGAAFSFTGFSALSAFSEVFLVAGAFCSDGWSEMGSCDGENTTYLVDRRGFACLGRKFDLA